MKDKAGLPKGDTMKKYSGTILSTSLVALLVTGQALAATITTLNVNFESPAFTTGPIGGNPGFSAGQGGWGGDASSISTAQAHSGTQSLRSGGTLITGATHSLDPATQGNYPVAGVTFGTSYNTDWWVQAWVRVASGGVGAQLSIPTWGWYLAISGTGTPSLESAIPGQPATSLANQGSNILDQWIFLQISHSSTAPCEAAGAPGRCMDFRILGQNVDLAYSRYYTASGPYSQYVQLRGDAYWDDVQAGYGPAPAPVPLPGAAWLFISAFGTLLGKARRETKR